MAHAPGHLGDLPQSPTSQPEGCPAEPASVDREGRELAATHLDGLAGVVAVVREQLDGVQAQTAEAVHDIVTRTSGVDTQLQALIGLLEKEAARILDRSVEEGRRLREEEGALQMLERFLERSAAHAQDRDERALNISSAAASAGPVIAELRELAMQSKVLSINASVESARQGGAFSVIAEEVRNVSTRSSAAVAQVEQAIARVASLVSSQVSEKRRNEEQRDGSDREQLKRFAALVAGRAEEQRQSNEERHRLLESIAQQHDQLRQRVIELLAATQFEDVTRQRVDGVRSALADMQGNLESLVSAMRAPEGVIQLPAVFEVGGLLENYVMEQQRAAHANALGEQAQADEQPKIELF